MTIINLLHDAFYLPQATRRHRWAALFALLGGIATWPSGAEEVPAPPYFISSSEAVVIGIAYDESRIKRLAPTDIQMAPGATGQIIMYKASENYGLPGYSSSFMALDIEEFDAPGGAKARWMLTGLYGPNSVTAAMVKYFDYPVKEGSTRLEHDGQHVTAVGTMGGAEIIRAELVLKPGPCQRGSGLIHEVTRNAGTGMLQLIKIPYVSDWCAAESASVEITAPANDLFKRFGPVKVLWSGYFSGGFGWSAPVNGR